MLLKSEDQLFKNVNKLHIPYDQIDVEMREVIKALNHIDGLTTIDCCFGHRAKYNHNLFVSLLVQDEDKFIEFWTYVFERTNGLGKINLTQYNGFEIYLNASIIPPEFHIFRLEIRPFHDPSVFKIGVVEKKKALKFLTQQIEAYLEQ